jgi:hypothetical protein
VNDFSKNNTLYLNKVKETFHNKLSNSMNTFYSNIKLVEVDNENKVKKNADDAVKKFEKFYYHLKDVKEQLRVKKEKHHDKMVNKKEMMEAIQKENDEKSIKIMEKLSDLTKRRELLMEKQHEKLLQMSAKEREKYEKLLHSKHNINEDRDRKMHVLLETQHSLIGRSNLKDSSISLNRTNVQYKIYIKN